MHEAMAGIEEKDQLLLMLRAEGHSFAEIAEILCDGDEPKKENTWVKRCGRAGIKLRKSFWDHAKREPEHVQAQLRGQGLLSSDDSSSD